MFALFSTSVGSHYVYDFDSHELLRQATQPLVRGEEEEPHSTCAIYKDMTPRATFRIGEPAEFDGPDPMDTIEIARVVSLVLLSHAGHILHIEHVANS